MSHASFLLACLLVCMHIQVQHCCVDPRCEHASRAILGVLHQQAAKLHTLGSFSHDIWI
jgi:hypothetical protein